MMETMASKSDKSAILILLIPTALVLVLVGLGLVFAISSGDARSIAVMLVVTLVCVGALLAGFMQSRRARHDAGRG